MQNDREAGQTLRNIFQNVKAQGRRLQDAVLVAGALFGFELVGAVAGADGNREGIAAGAFHEFLHVLGTGVGTFGMADFVFDAGERAEFGFDDHAVIVRVFHHFLRDGDVFFKGLAGGVDHDGGEAAVHAALAGLEGIAVIEVQADRKTAVFHGRFDQFL